MIECDVGGCDNKTPGYQVWENGWTSVKIAATNHLVTVLVCPEHKLNAISSRSILADAITTGIQLIDMEEQDDKRIIK